MHATTVLVNWIPVGISGSHYEKKKASMMLSMLLSALSTFQARNWRNGHLQVLMPTFREQKFSPKFFLTEVFGNPLGSWTSAPSGHGYPRSNACFSRISSALTEVWGRDIRANDPRMSAGCPSQKQDFLFGLIFCS